MVFPAIMYGCESWTINKAERRRIDAFELWCWRRLLRVPWTARRSNQSILKEISPECSLEGLMLKLKLQYFGHLMGRTDLFEKTLMLGKMEGRRRRGQNDRRCTRAWDQGFSISQSRSKDIKASLPLWFGERARPRPDTREAVGREAALPVLGDCCYRISMLGTLDAQSARSLETQNHITNRTRKLGQPEGLKERGGERKWLGPVRLIPTTTAST